MMKITKQPFHVGDKVYASNGNKYVITEYEHRHNLTKEMNDLLCVVSSMDEMGSWEMWMSDLLSEEEYKKLRRKELIEEILYP